jgi:polyisoprenoid-binding protein YceI
MNITPITQDNHTNLALERWQLDPSLSTVAFRARSFWGLQKVRGRFDHFVGHLEVDDVGRRSMRLTIDADSLATGNGRRDKHLRSADFFDSEHHPHVSFTSISVSDAGEGRLLVRGELEAAGKSVELELHATARRSGDGLEIEAETTVDRRGLGMSSGPLAMIRPLATLTVQARLRRGDAGEP